MQMLCSRGEDQLDRQAQDIAGKNAQHHFRVTPHMPDAERPPGRRLARQGQGLLGGHALDPIGHGGAAIAQTPLVHLQRNQSVDGGGHTRVTLFDVEDNDVGVGMEHGVRGGVGIGKL